MWDTPGLGITPAELPVSDSPIDTGHFRARLIALRDELRAAERRRALLEQSLDLQVQTLRLVQQRVESGLARRLDQLIAKKPIDTRRIYLTGLSMGGYGTWDLIARQPERFAAAIPICGGGDPATAERIKHIPLWVFHGDADSAVKVSRSRDMVAALKQAGGEPKYTEYEGVGHDSWTRTYKSPEIYEWLFSQRLSQ